LEEEWAVPMKLMTPAQERKNKALVTYDRPDVEIVGDLT
jgi:hypothetical protein